MLIDTESILETSGTDPSFASIPTLSAPRSRYDAIAVGYPYRGSKEAVELAKRELAGFTLGCTSPLDQQGAQLLRLSCYALRCRGALLLARQRWKGWRLL